MKEDQLNESYEKLIELSYKVNSNDSQIKQMVSLLNIRNFINDLYKQGFADCEKLYKKNLQINKN